ncbi:MAG: hypothetical protein ACI9TY_001706 [Alphaproteobacteria bacterium]|jgi:hypothetical protein
MASYEQSANIANVFDQFMNNPQMSVHELTETCSQPQNEITVSRNEDKSMEMDDGFSR